MAHEAAWFRSDNAAGQGVPKRRSAFIASFVEVFSTGRGERRFIGQRRGKRLPRLRFHLEGVGLQARPLGLVLKFLGHLDHQSVGVLMPLQVLIHAEHADLRAFLGLDQLASVNVSPGHLRLMT